MRAIAAEERGTALGRHEDDLAADPPPIRGGGEGARLGLHRADTLDRQRPFDREGKEGIEGVLAYVLDPRRAALIGDVPESLRLILRPGVPLERAEIFDIPHHPLCVNRIQHRGFEHCTYPLPPPTRRG